MADKRNIIEHKRIRKIDGSFSFSWIDHRIITGGFWDELSTIEMLLYFFLVAVSDRYGVSFYHNDRICHILKIGIFELGDAREGLMQKSLIAYKFPVYQVLALPEKPVAAPTKEELAEVEKSKALSYIQKIKQIAGARR